MCSKKWKPLEHNGDSDYTLKPGETSVWITVDNISVYVRRTDEGVIVDLYPHFGEMYTELGSTYAFFSEAEEAQEETNEID